MSNYFAPRTTSRAQPSIKSAMATKEHRDAVDMAVGRWWFDANIPFNAANSKFFRAMCDAIASIGPGYKMPSYHNLRTRILKNIVEEVNDFMEHYKSSWTETGCSIMSDGWTDGKQRTLINFLVYCPKGVIFLKSVDASGIRKNADALFSIFDEVVLFVGPEKVVQFITDNDATYKATGKRLAEKYRTFYWTGCAAHCIDLMLEEMAKPKLFPKNAVTIDTARKVTRFIYNHTRCLYKFRNELRQMFTSNAWSAMSVSSTLVGEEISGIVLDNSFWKNVEHIVSVSESLVKIGLQWGIYMRQWTAKKAIQRRLKKKSEFLPYWRVIDRRWETQLHSPLHAAAYFLNPGLYFDPKFDKQREVKRGMNDVVEKLVCDDDIRDIIVRQITDYKRSHHSFGSATAVRNRAKISPENWWDQYGIDCPKLQTLAIRMISQCCSSSGCERNWSIF
ncbi:hypothetical protein CKAN_02260300 [Cinnamomum micranthum f. kanehirae]|uniref:DUF659 domain-containing protein n=1 Tax=Cinnamomum micranthum f. kanehirae TaxID=337451 RepID=A0A3S3NE87_9MAGN|nr:hypothetical protein CKAN_02260300 [Cinnamomum micranthum f. kanehirae]